MFDSTFLLWKKFKISTKKLNRFPLYQEARTRILLWYILLMFLFVVTAIPTIRHRIFLRVNERVKEDMREELEEFDEQLVESLLESSIKPDNQSSVGNQKNNQIYQIFDQFINNKIAEDDNYFIAIVDGSFYKSSSLALPKVISPDSKLMERWQNITEDVRGEEKVADREVGSIIYKARAIKTTNKTVGVFIVAHATGGERAEALSAIDVVIKVLIFMLAIALFLAWFVAGRVLAPIRELADKVKLINESDLSQRIDVKGEGELAQLGKTFNAMMNRLESAFATQRNFVNDAGHELRTPITIIRGHLELMEDDPQEQEETIALVIDELDRMNRLVDDLILLAKAERPDFLQPEIIHVASFTEELFNKIRVLNDKPIMPNGNFSRENCSLLRRWHIDNIGKGTVICDRQRLTQAIINLAHNAVQHTKAGSTIALGSESSKDQVKFWIRDTGEGIPENEQQRIFERFARVKNNPRRSEGSGLGLAIVKAIAEAHNGYIQLQSHLGTGSTFILILPLKSN